MIFNVLQFYVQILRTAQRTVINYYNIRRGKTVHDLWVTFSGRAMTCDPKITSCEQIIWPVWSASAVSRFECFHSLRRRRRLSIIFFNETHCWLCKNDECILNESFIVFFTDCAQHVRFGSRSSPTVAVVIIPSIVDEKCPH